jgi:hypothetical protein
LENDTRNQRKNFGGDGTFLEEIKAPSILPRRVRLNKEPEFQNRNSGSLNSSPWGG